MRISICVSYFMNKNKKKFYYLTIIKYFENKSILLIIFNKNKPKENTYNFTVVIIN